MRAWVYVLGSYVRRVNVEMNFISDKSEDMNEVKGFVGFRFLLKWNAASVVYVNDGENENCAFINVLSGAN